MQDAPLHAKRSRYKATKNRSHGSQIFLQQKIPLFTTTSPICSTISSAKSNMFTIPQQNFPLLSAKSTTRLCKSLAISSALIILCTIFTLLSNNSIFTHNESQIPNTPSPINTSHVVFGIASSSNTWRNRRPYIESWWRPNATRGFIFLERVRREFLPWPPSSPPLRLSEDTSRYREFNRHRTNQAIRLVHMIAETFVAENTGVRWYVMMDDDTIVFVDNLLEVLGKYDHRKYFYVGANSESVSSNFFHSFEMAFGGGGYALSYPLAEALVNNLDVCIKRYTTLYGSDHIVQCCAADLGVSLTLERGFHQIDLHRDISGFLSAHPQSPLLTLHHLDAVDPIFPTMDRRKSLNHLMEAAKADSSRLLQQTFCHHKAQNWTFSVSWGYSAQIYEGIHPPSVLQRPIETFIPWSRAARPPYMFNTRLLSRNPCEAPHVFFFDTVEETNGTHIVTAYNRTSTLKLTDCSSSGNHSANHIFKIRVLSSVTRYNQAGRRRECCDMVQEAGMNTTEVKLRACMKDEILA